MSELHSDRGQNNSNAVVEIAKGVGDLASACFFNRTTLVIGSVVALLWGSGEVAKNLSHKFTDPLGGKPATPLQADPLSDLSAATFSPAQDQMRDFVTIPVQTQPTTWSSRAYDATIGKLFPSHPEPAKIPDSDLNIFEGTKR